MTSFKKQIKAPNTDTFGYWVKSGAPWVWLNAAAVSASILLVVGLLLLIAVRGLGHFWPAAVYEVTYQGPDGAVSTFAGQIREREDVLTERLRESGLTMDTDAETVERILFKTGNRDLTGEDFRWVLTPGIQSKSAPEDLVVLERVEWGAFFGRVAGVKRDGETVGTADPWAAFIESLERTADLREQIEDLEKDEIGSINYRMERLRLAERKL